MTLRSSTLGNELRSAKKKKKKALDEHTSLWVTNVFFSSLNTSMKVMLVVTLAQIVRPQVV